MNFADIVQFFQTSSIFLIDILLEADAVTTCIRQSKEAGFDAASEIYVMTRTFI